MEIILLIAILSTIMAILMAAKEYIIEKRKENDHDGKY